MPITQDGKIRAYLSQVGYDGDDNHCVEWDGRIEFEVLPNGAETEPVGFDNYPVAAGGPPHVPDQLVYEGKGGFHGSYTPEAVLNFRISVWGTNAEGLPIQGCTEAKIPHPGSDTIHPAPSYCIVVPLLPPPPPPGPNPPDPPRLWFNFSVGTVC